MMNIKNYKPQELKASNEREDLILQIDENRFCYNRIRTIPRIYIQMIPIS